MAQKQASFNIAKRKGELGETIFREYLEKRGWIVYFPFTKDRPHYFDMLATKNKDKVIACDVKTKARLNFKPATGINIKAYKEYKNFMERAKIPFYLIFVDDKTGDVHLLDIAKTGEGEILKNGHIMIWEIKKCNICSILAITISNNYRNMTSVIIILNRPSRKLLSEKITLKYFLLFSTFFIDNGGKYDII